MTAAHAPAPPGGPDPEDAFAAGVRAAIEAAGLPLRQVARRLREYGDLSSSIATLSDWRNGRFHPTPGELGRSRVLALERCLGVRAGDLLLLLPSTPTTYQTRSQAGRRAMDPLTVRRDALLRQVARQVEPPQRMIPVAHEKEYALGWRTAPAVTTVTSTVRALTDGVDRYLFVHAPDPRLHPRVAATGGCRLGDVHPEPVLVPDRLEVVELLFDRALRCGDRYTFSYSVAYCAESVAPALCEPVFRHVQLAPCERLTLRLSTAPGWPLADVRQCRWPKARNLLPEGSVPVAPDGRGGFEQSFADPVPGGYGWRWRPLPPSLTRPPGRPSAA